MLKRKQLHPWLLINLILSFLLFLSTIAIIIIIIINEINGFNFISAQYSTCLLSSNYKFSQFIDLILKTTFVLGVFSILFSLAQTIVLAFYFVKFWKSKDQQTEEEYFQQISKKGLLLLYVFNSIIFLSLLPVFGTFLSFYLQFDKCSGAQNMSSSYLIPWIISGTALIIQIFCCAILFKLCYHFNCELSDSHENDQKSMNTHEFHSKIPNQEIKIRILQSNHHNKQMNIFGIPSNYPSSRSSETDQSPQQINQRLLNKVQMNRIGRNQNKNSIDQLSLPNSNTIYGGQRRVKNGLKGGGTQKSKQLNGNKNQNNTSVNAGQNSKMATPLNSNEGNYDKNSSPNTISAKQKQLMKTIPKYPFKKNGSNKLNASDVIFQEQSSKQDGSLHNYKPQNNNIGQAKQNLKSKNNPSNPQNIAASSPNNQTPSQKYGQNGKIQPKTDFSNSKYFNSPYFKNLQNKKITPEQRRNIKKKHLKIQSNIFQFDAKNYDAEDLLLEQANLGLDNLDRKKSQNKPQLGNLNTLNNSAIQNEHENGQSLNPDKEGVLVFQKLKNSKSQLIYSKKLNYSRSKSNLEKSMLRDKQLQDQNPLFDYVMQDQGYDNQITKRIEFQILNNKKKKGNFYNPFDEGGIEQKSTQGKLYLHKNKQRNGGGRSNMDQADEQKAGFDPFHDDAYQDEILIQRNLTLEKQESKPSLASLLMLKKPKQSQNLSSTQVKKSNRKDGLLLDFIRSKYSD